MNPNNKLILCYDETQKDKSFLVPQINIQNVKCDGDDQFDIGNGNKILFKNLRIKKLDESPELGPQPEEEKMVKVYNLINKIKSGPLNKNYKTKNIEGNVIFVNNNYISKLKNESNGDENETKYKIKDVFGKNKIIVNKEIIDKDSKPGEYIIIKNTNDNENYLVDFNELINSLNNFNSTDENINITNALNNEKIKINPLNIIIVPPYNNFPIEKINKNEIEIKDDEDNKEKQIEKNEEEEKDNYIGRMRLRSMPARNMPEKKTYKIRRAIIYKKQRKDSQ